MSQKKKANYEVFIESLESLVQIGTTSEEREQPQAILISISATVCTPCIHTHYVNYMLLVEYIHTIAHEKQYILLEELSYYLGDSLLHSFPLQSVKVRVSKNQLSCYAQKIGVCTYHTKTTLEGDVADESFSIVL